MKKLIMLLAIVAITVTLSNDVFAQGGKLQKMKQLRTNFVDLDGDGICDNKVTTTPPTINTRVASSFVDANGDGVCDNAGTGNGRKLNFVDVDGDGVCDNAGNPVKQQLRDGTGAGNGNKAGMKKRGNK